MKRQLLLFLALALPLSLSACGKRLTMDDALGQGARQLTSSDVAALVMDRTIHVSSWDNAIEADVTLHDNGTLSGRNSVGEKTGGRWKLTADNTLCLSYDDWGQREMRCFAVVEQEKGFTLFRADGSLDATFTVTDGSAAPLSFTGVGTGQAMPGSDGIVRTDIIPDEGKSSDQANSSGQGKKGGWWTLGLFDGNGDEETADLGALPPASREKRHLLDDNECAHCTLVGENLREAKLKKAELEGTDLTDADLSRATLRGANLKKATLKGTKLAGTDLTAADLAGADLSGADLEGAILENADLTGARLAGARLADAVLREAILTNADLSEANLHWADLAKADLKGANLKKSYLIKANFTKADLTGADLSEAVTQRAIFDKSTGYGESAADTPEQTDRPEEEKAEKKSWFSIFR